MMTYEIYLTDSCNRNCSFCHIEKTGYVETLANIEIFCNFIKNKHLNTDTDFSIHLFGGEPLLNIDGIKYIISSFYDYSCDICLITNGDLLTSNIFTKNEIDRLKVLITTYDFITNSDHYYNFSLYIKNLSFSYTFSECDIDKLDNFYDFCKKKNIKSHISFSHSNKSWKEISTKSLYNSVYCFVYKIFNEKYKNKQIPDMFDNDFKRIVLLLFDYDEIKPILCIDNDTIVFYRGQFLKSCIHQVKTDILLNNCNNCDYNKICIKTCLLSLINGEVPEKLCNIKKAIYDAILDFIHLNMNDSVMKKLLKQYSCNMFV